MTEPSTPRWNFPDLAAAARNPEARPFSRGLNKVSDRIKEQTSSGMADLLARAAQGLARGEPIEGQAEWSANALAWAWSELDARELALARALTPVALVDWLGGSFEHPRIGLVGGRAGPRVAAMDLAQSLSAEGAPLRRALRAKTLACLQAQPEIWSVAVRSALANGSAEWSSSAPELLKAAKAGAWRAGEVVRGAALFIGGMCASGLLPLAPLFQADLAPETAALAVGHLAAGGLAAWGLRGMLRSRNRPDPFHGPLLDEVWGRSGKAMLRAVYPDLAERGVFAAWGQAGLLDSSRDLAYEGLALAGFDTAALSRPVKPDALFIPGGLGSATLDEALAARFERAQIESECPPSQAPSPAPRRPRI